MIRYLVISRLPPTSSDPELIRSGPYTSWSLHDPGLMRVRTSWILAEGVLRADSFICEPDLQMTPNSQTLKSIRPSFRIEPFPKTTASLVGGFDRFRITIERNPVNRLSRPLVGERTPQLATVFVVSVGISLDLTPANPCTSVLPERG